MRRLEINLLVFDWDGTLADTAACIVTAMQTAITACGYPARDDRAIRDVIGLGLEEASHTLYPELGVAERLTLTETYRRIYVRQNRGKTNLFSGVDRLLDNLNQLDYLLAIATGKSRKGLEHSLQETGLVGLFHASRCADETLSKPHPMMLREIMDELSVEPENTLMIGDSQHDLQMAGNAGVQALAVSYGTQSKADLLKYDPLACLDSPEGILDWLVNGIQ